MVYFSDTFIFFATVLALFFLPGLMMLRTFLKPGTRPGALESFVLSFALGLGFLNFLMILMSRAGIHFSATTLASGLFATVTLITVAPLFFQKFFWSKRQTENTTPLLLATNDAPFSKKQQYLFLTLLLLTVLIKTTYLSHTVLPTATDLGHHMYWSKVIAETGKLPVYAKRDIITDSDGTFRISAPEPIADFIIGEHLPFAAINIFSRLDFLSAFPILFLFFINLMTLLALAVLTRTLATHIKSPALSERIFTPQNIALATLLLFGPLYTLASPEAKFVSGGVVGNTIGNLFLPLIILAYLRAFREKRSDFLALGFFLTFSLAYIHHLSTLMTLFALGAAVILYLGFHWKTLGTTLTAWYRLILKPKPLTIMFLTCLFFFLVAMPTYIETHAIGTALGTPTKTTRTGLSFYQITFSSGEARVALGLAGLFLFTLLRTRTRYGSVFLMGWGLILFIMTLRPDWLFINIPSSRIGAYLSFPLGLLAAFALVGTIAFLVQDTKKYLLPGTLVLFLSFAYFVFTFGSGSYDNSQTLLPQSKALATVETFAASRYLAAHITPSDLILKDHNYIAADSWMKLFFLRDYSFPLSRGFFKRYEDNPNREQCTLLMISVPNTPQAQKCYTETGTNLIVVNPAIDNTSFEKSKNFSRIYTSEDINIYARKQ